MLFSTTILFLDFDLWRAESAGALLSGEVGKSGPDMAAEGEAQQGSKLALKKALG